MAKIFRRTILYLLLVAMGVGGVFYWRAVHSQDAAAQSLAQRNIELEAQKRKLEAQKIKLETTVTRLTAENRVAEVIVEDQQVMPCSGRPADGAFGNILPPATLPAQCVRTTLLFVERARDGTMLPPRRFLINGSVAHIDALVIKFERGFIAENDSLRGHSVALFCRVYGEDQSPRDGLPIDAPGAVPDAYNDKKLSAEQRVFEAGLWKDFWRLADDKQFRVARGVRVADGQDVWGPFLPDHLYTITLGSDGSLSLVSEPMPAIYAEALRKQRSGRDAGTASIEK